MNEIQTNARNGGNSQDPLKVVTSECQSIGNSYKCPSSCLVAQSASVLNFQCDGNSKKRLRDHCYSEEVQGCPPEEQNRRTQEQIVAVDVISTMDEGRPGEHLHAALPVRGERLPAGALQRGLAGDLGSPSFSCPTPSSSRCNQCCSTEASLVTAAKSHQTTLLFEYRQERRLPATDRRLAVVCSVLPTGAVHSHPRRGVVFPFLSHALSPVDRQGDLGREVDDMKATP